MKFIKRLFCRHIWYHSIGNEKFNCLGVEQLYKRCGKCGKVKKWKDIHYEGGGYK